MCTVGPIKSDPPVIIVKIGIIYIYIVFCLYIPQVLCTMVPRNSQIPSVPSLDQIFSEQTIDRYSQIFPKNSSDEEDGTHPPGNLRRGVLVVVQKITDAVFSFPVWFSAPPATVS